MVEPSAKKEAVEYLLKVYKEGVGRCTSVMRISRSNWYYTSKKDDSELCLKLKDLSEKYPTRGIDNYYGRLRREGYKWSRKRVLRVYRELGLVRRPKRRRRLPESMREPLKQSYHVNEVWSMDFMSDCLEDGRPFRVLNVIDDYNRESLIVEGDISLPSERVIRSLERIGESRGYPRQIRTDNGPEFQSKKYREWCVAKGIEALHIQPGKPKENGYVERFNRTFREDVLDAYHFSTLRQFNVVAQKWQWDYNELHPHKSLGLKSPNEFRKENKHAEVFGPTSLIPLHA